MPIGVISSGFKLVLRHWRAVLLIQLLSLLLAGVPACVVGESIAESVEHSASAESLRAGYDDLWYRYFKSEATGLAGTFDPSSTGAGSLLGALDTTLTGKLFDQQAGLFGLGLLYLGVWVFFSGALLRAFWDGDPLAGPEFMAHGARYFGRLLGLGILGLAGYWVILGILHGQIQSWLDEVTRNWIDERHIAGTIFAKYAFLWILVGFWMMWLDTARVLVVGQDAGLFKALAQGRKLLTRSPARIAFLYLALLGLLGLYVALFVALIPGAGQASYAGLLWFLLVSQVLFFIRLVLRLLRPAGLMALYRESGAISGEIS